MHQGIIIYSDKSIHMMNPRFTPGDETTRRFANHASDAIQGGGIGISISESVNIQSLDQAIEMLTVIRDEQIKSEETYGRIEKEG